MDRNVFKHYEVGVAAMDSEHWTLLEGVAQVHALVQQGLVQDAHKKIAELKALLLDHFNHEETMMEEIGFPYLSYHKIDHQKTLSLLEKIYEKFPHTNYHEDCVKPVERLMMTHFDSMDSQYASYHKAWLAKNKPEEEGSLSS